ncbi:YceH family protein [Teredinibacter turnerae]|uniref:YceH family protein n=1 Tax=Teredinibacter turnerae TaxID=2426 RepID=UPI0004015659|nr:YceH family protein [Teredinibacter turnerae]
MKLSDIETRVLGVLMEKAITTPDQYPLSLNALTTGCNQKTNREPVMQVSESEVLDAVTQLIEKSVVSEVRIGTRVSKYQHRFSGTEFAKYKFNKAQQAILCLLFLRGPQTPGELRSRSQRLFEFDNVQQAEASLAELEEKEYVVQLAREPGRREARFAHLFGEGEPQVAAASAEASVASEATPALEQRVTELEQRVADLEAMLNELMA